ncbi:hypothetical protein BK133_02485 [Paenibacillus sp. FSL H8-0548]|uniref:GNAT family N-acetyltransferase n=1 Tax=Paenibacillus sp. FSL H8-0548 TaxID=1920422 RepID=UPI00096E1782|nr:GNAT family N-acetyltransferase [Paenibacillus sp. FSL H8-0548]OMF38409.1 hypothetical protein BK133_02485 [Paenibacillus sp. FSL H8-0548]
MFLDELTIARLSEADRDNLAIFDCLNTEEYAAIERRAKKRLEDHSKDMNRFLIYEALEEQEEGYNTTYLLRDSLGLVIAYISLCADAIRLNYKERNNGAIGYEMFPSLKIARLAVHKDYQKHGIGTTLISFAVSKALIMRETVGGVKFITLDCYAHRLSYYTNTKIGFEENLLQTNHGERNKPISLRLHIDNYLDKWS